MDVRWAAGNPDRMRTFAKELVDLQCDVILSQTTPVTAALHRETQTIPIIFVMVADPVGSGFVASVARPGGNLTGFMVWEPSMPGKWLELLTEIAPAVRRVAIMFNPDTAPYVTSYSLPSFEAAARSFKVEPIVAPIHSDAELRRFVARSSYCWQRETMYRQSIRTQARLGTAVCFLLERSLGSSISPARSRACGSGHGGDRPNTRSQARL
jgi:putative ABC transport system substrate-binding protein